MICLTFIYDYSHITQNTEMYNIEKLLSDEFGLADGRDDSFRDVRKHRDVVFLSLVGEVTPAAVVVFDGRLR